VCGFRDHAGLIRPAAEDLQLLIGGEVQVSQPSDGPLHHHQFPAFPVQNQEVNQVTAHSALTRTRTVVTAAKTSAVLSRTIKTQQRSFRYL
jgi:hypothetical protein